MGCFNCVDPSHVLKDCPNEVKLTRAAKSGLEYMECKNGKKINTDVFLFALCQQLAESAEENSSNAPMKEGKENNKNQELFSTLMVEVESDVCRTESQEKEILHLVSIEIDVYLLNDDEEDLLARFSKLWPQCHS